MEAHYKRVPNSYMIFSSRQPYNRGETSQVKQKRVAARWRAMSDDEKLPYRNQFIALTKVFKENYKIKHNKDFKYAPRKRNKPKPKPKQDHASPALLIVLPPLVVVDPETAGRAWPSV